MSYFTQGVTDDMRQTNRDGLFSVTRDDIIHVARTWVSSILIRFHLEPLLFDDDTCFLFRYLASQDVPNSIAVLGPANDLTSNDSSWTIRRESLGWLWKLWLCWTPASVFASQSRKAPSQLEAHQTVTVTCSVIELKQNFIVADGWIGPLHNPVTWYGINCAGTQVTATMKWDFQNKGKSGWTGTRSFILEVPLCNVRPSIINSVPCDRIVQRAY